MSQLHDVDEADGALTAFHTANLTRMQMGAIRKLL